MPKLLKKIDGQFLNSYSTNITYLSSVSGEIQQEDYINLNGFIAFLQDLTQVQVTSALKKPLTFGLKNNRNLNLNVLNIDY